MAVVEAEIALDGAVEADLSLCQNVYIVEGELRRSSVFSVGVKLLLACCTCVVGVLEDTFVC